MDINQQLNGFRICSRRKMPELDGEMYEMEHEKSGARLVWLNRAEENKTFGIAFRTVPEDDTGVFHILEHSVLCGSEQYPLKEPFLELMKGSLQTFLNAMTFPDKTFYPVSSRNGKDFLNLMRVYMDAVLHPLIYRRPEIFEQEGWRYEFSVDDQVSCQGVVLNEMKGAFSSPDTRMEYEMNRKLFPDSCYRYVSGGDPDRIPDLTYEQFLDNHRRFYHPSNSYIFLDGRIDVKQVLSVLNEEYLSGYQRQNREIIIPIQPPVKAKPVQLPFAAAPNASPDGRTRLGLGYVIGDYTCQKELLAVQLLTDALCGSNDAPLKRRILSDKLAQDVRIKIMGDIRQPYAAVEILDMEKKDIEQVCFAVENEFTRLAEEGLDHENLKAVLASQEFRMRERDFGVLPQGVGFGIAVLGSWLYGGDPAASLEVDSLFAELKAEIEQGYFERLLEQIFLKNPHTCQVALVPSATFGQESQNRERIRLQKAQEQWTGEQRLSLKERQKKRVVWQSAPDSAETIARLPKLQLSDISAKPEHIPTAIEKIGEIPLLNHLLPTGGTDYVNLYFDISDLEAEDFPVVALLCCVLSNLDTDLYSAAKLQQMQRLELGNLRFSVETYSSENQPESCRIVLCVSYSAVEETLADGTALIAEILLGTRFENSGKIYELLLQAKARTEQSIITNGSAFAVTRVSAGVSAEGVIREATGGITWYQWLKDLGEHYADRTAVLQREFAKLCSRIFDIGRLTASITGRNEKAADILKEYLLERLPYTVRDKATCKISPWGIRREGIVIPSEVSYTAMGGSLLQNGAPYSGITPLLGRVMRLSWLWNAIRVQGGAYGTGFGTGETGNACCYSFRDPNAARSLACYRQAPDALSQFLESCPDLTAFIIGTVADSEPLLLPKMQGKVADQLYWRETSYQELCKRRSDLLKASLTDLEGFILPLDRLIGNAGICVIGSKGQIDACKAELDEVLTL